MKWFYDLKVSTKLLASFVLVAVITLIVGYVGYSGITEIGANQNTLYLDRLIPIRDLGYANSALLTARGDIVAALGTTDMNKRKTYVASIRNATKEVDELIEAYSKTVLVKAEEETLPKFLAAWNEYKRQREDAIEYLLSMKDDECRQILYGPSLPHQLEARKHLRALIDINSKVADELDVATDARVSSDSTLLIVFVLIAALLAVGLGVFISNIISKPIRKTVFMIQELSMGHLGNRLKIDTKDEIGLMAQTMDQFSEDLQKRVIATLVRISEGDTSIEVKVKDDKDEITPALIRMVDTTKDLINEAAVLSTAAVEGKLSTRGNAAKFKGGFKEIIEGVNNTLDAVIKPVMEGSDVLEVMASGDFTPRVKGIYHGDHQMITNSINKLGDSVARILHDVTDAVSATASASNQISSSTEELAAGAQEQSAQSQEIASAVNQMTSTILETSKHANTASINAKNAGAIAKEGGKVVQETVEGMNRVALVVSRAGETVKELGKGSDQIGEIVQVIDDIADQTNLLALNAAIEAARAGEQGRGFAVVADEVRKLAERTTKATKEIATMIKRIQKDTSEAVVSMDEGTKEVERGKELAAKAGESLKQIISAADEVVDVINQVAAASEEQSSTSEQISRNIESISNVTHESASGTQQIARAAEDLNRLTTNLQELISQFKIDEIRAGNDRAQYVVHESGKLKKLNRHL